MKARKLCCAAAALTLALALSACRGQSVLVAGVDVSQIPLSFRDSKNNPTGFEVDLATEAAKRAGMTVRFVAVDWAQRQESLKTGKVSSLWGELPVGEDSGILYTHAYMRNNQILVAASTSGVHAKEDLNGKSVGTINGSHAAAALLLDSISANLAGGAPQYYTDTNNEFMALQAGQIDAVAADETLGRYYINQNTIDYRILPGTLATETYAVGVRRNDSRLRNAIQKALDSMLKDGTAKSLSMKWFGADFTLKQSG